MPNTADVFCSSPVDSQVLPHTLNPLIYVNNKLMYQVLCRTATQLLSTICNKQFDCAPGMDLILHTWGQKMNLHAHVHIIMTAGGVSSG